MDQGPFLREEGPCGPDTRKEIRQMCGLDTIQSGFCPLLWNWKTLKRSLMWIDFDHDWGSFCAKSISIKLVLWIQPSSKKTSPTTSRLVNITSQLMKKISSEPLFYNFMQHTSMSAPYTKTPGILYTMAKKWIRVRSVIGTFPDTGYVAHVDHASRNNLEVGLYGVLFDDMSFVRCVPFLIQKSQTVHPHQGIF